MSPSDATIAAARPRWDGQPGRVEVWYATFTDESNGVGGWVHYETVSPVAADEGGDPGDPYAHGWFSWFPADGPPVTERFGPEPVEPAQRTGPWWFDCASVKAGVAGLTGQAGETAWDIQWEDASEPLYTFPKVAWERELLPAAQIVPAPTAKFTGEVHLGGDTLKLDATGGLAHIFGHGNAKRWAWLHADLGGGDVLELVSAVSLRPGLNRLPPIAFLRFRISGRDFPPAGLPALRLRSRLELPNWSVRGAIGGRRVRIEVHQPPERNVALSYSDPDGATATCTNTEQADAEIVIERRASGRWYTDREWSLTGTAHAEVGLRP